MSLRMEAVRAVNQPEAAKRIRAAMAYVNLSRAAAATAMHVSPGTLDRYTGKKGQETATPTWDQLWDLAIECDLDPDWFGADLGRLSEIVPAGTPTLARPRTPQEIAKAAALRRASTPPPSREDRDDTDESGQAA